MTNIKSTPLHKSRPTSAARESSVAYSRNQPVTSSITQISYVPAINYRPPLDRSASSGYSRQSQSCLQLPMQFVPSHSPVSRRFPPHDPSTHEECSDLLTCFDASHTKSMSRLAVQLVIPYFRSSG